MEPIHLGGISPHLQLLALQEESSQTQREGDRQEVDRLDHRVDAARAFQRFEIQRAQEEREDASMWEEVAGTFKTVSIVAASAAAIAASGGSGTAAVIVAAGAAMKLGAKVGEETGVIDADAARMLDTGGTVVMAGGAAFGVAAAASGASYAAAEGATTTVVQGARMVSVGASAAEGFATKRSSDHASNALDHDGYARSADSIGDVAAQDRDAVVDRSARLAEHERWVAGQTATNLIIENQGRTGLIANIGGKR